MEGTPDPAHEATEEEAGPPAPLSSPHPPLPHPPRVAIVGRPNVGKSTLFNALVGSRVAIVEPTPGVTRDRVSALTTLAERTVELVDTGGIGIADRDDVAQDVEAQAARAVEDADAILFVVDAREGRTPLDERVARRLRRAASRVVLLANKVEGERASWGLGELESLGFGSPLPVSAQQREGLADVEERLGALLPEDPFHGERPPPPELRLALVGRRNAGKSSLVNALAREERMIVSEVPGTTRDSVDVRLEREGRAVVVIDTAGIRKEKRVQGSLEFYAQRRAEKAMRRADVTALVLDATVEAGRLDRRIAAYALEHHHPVLVVANKWDLRPPDVRAADLRRYLRSSLPGLAFAPVVFTSAQTGRGIGALLGGAWDLLRQARTRVGTAAVNRALEQAQALRRPRPRHGKVGQIYYGTQIDVAPPTFLLFVNDPSLFEPAWLRYLQNRFREHLPFPNVPVRFRLQARTRRGQEGEGVPGGA